MMTLTLAPDTETRLQTVAEELGLAPEQLHEDLLRQALAETQLKIEAEKIEAKSLADLTTQAAMAGPIFDLWNTPEEDEAWAHLAEIGKQ